MPSGVALGRRRVPLANHSGPSDHPITTGLINAAWGSPLRDIWGALPISGLPTVRPGHDGRGGCIGNASFNTNPQYWRAFVTATTNTPVTIFAFVWLDSTSQRGIVCGIGNAANQDTGINIGVGNTAPDAAGNNIVGVRGGINYDASSAAIGTGLHSIAKTTDGSSNEAWWLDGVRVSTTGTGASWTLTSGTTRFQMMNHGASTTLGPSAGIHTYFGAAWNRVLRAGEMALLHDNPWIVARG